MSTATEDTAIQAVETETGGALAETGEMRPEVVEGPEGYLKPRTIEEAWRLAKILTMSDMVPKDYRGKPENAFVAMQLGAEIGISPMSSLQNISNINGKPSIYGKLGTALLLAQPDLVDIEECFEGEQYSDKQKKEWNDGYTAVCVVTRKGMKPKRGEFSVEDAKRAGIWGANVHKSYPKDMLMWRARWRAYDKAYADVFMGVSPAEIMKDVIEGKAEVVELTDGTHSVKKNTKTKAPAEEQRPPAADPFGPDPVIDEPAQTPEQHDDRVAEAVTEGDVFDLLKAAQTLADLETLRKRAIDELDLAGKKKFFEAYRTKRAELQGKADGEDFGFDGGEA